MRLDPQVAGRLTVHRGGGGHMFYAWESSRKEFTDAIATFVAVATGQGAHFAPVGACGMIVRYSEEVEMAPIVQASRSRGRG
jgi:hypothetical protein